MGIAHYVVDQFLHAAQTRQFADAMGLYIRLVYDREAAVSDLSGRLKRLESLERERV